MELVDLFRCSRATWYVFRVVYISGEFCAVADVCNGLPRVFWGVQTPPPKFAVLPKLGPVPSSVAYTYVNPNQNMSFIHLPIEWDT
jgi:hypothetical protein